MLENCIDKSLLSPEPSKVPFSPLGVTTHSHTHTPTPILTSPHSVPKIRKSFLFYLII